MRPQRVGRMLIVGFVLVMLAGCVTNIAPVRPLATSGRSAITTEVAGAVDSNGTKHYVWAECTTSGSIVC